MSDRFADNGGLMSPYARLFRFLAVTLSVIVFVYLLTLAISSLSEITSRYTALGNARQSMTELKGEIAAQVGQSDGQSDIVRLKRDLTTQSFQYRLLRQLDASGQASGELCPGVVGIQLCTERGGGPDLKVPAYVESMGLLGTLIYYLGVPTMPVWPTERIFTLLLIVCGGIGGTISGLRQSMAATPRDLVLGLAAGFIVYLAIKGGKYVFLLQTGDQTLVMNPYGGAFAALLAGLFTERAYQFLSKLLDDLQTRIERALRGQDTPQRSMDTPTVTGLPGPESQQALPNPNRPT